MCTTSGTNGVKSWEERTGKQVNSQWQELKHEKLKRSGAAQAWGEGKLLRQVEVAGAREEIFIFFLFVYFKVSKLTAYLYADGNTTLEMRKESRARLSDMNECVRAIDSNGRSRCWPWGGAGTLHPQQLVGDLWDFSS